MSSELLSLLTIFGIAVVIAVQGYILVMLGRGLAQPEEQAQLAARLAFTGLALLALGLLTAVVAVVLMVTRR